MKESCIHSSSIDSCSQVPADTLVASHLVVFDSRFSFLGVWYTIGFCFSNFASQNNHFNSFKNYTVIKLFVYKKLLCKGRAQKYTHAGSASSRGYNAAGLSLPHSFVCIDVPQKVLLYAEYGACRVERNARHFHGNIARSRRRQ